MNKNVWHTLESYLCMQGGLVQDNGHSLVPVLRKSGSADGGRRDVFLFFMRHSDKRQVLTACAESLRAGVHCS